MKVYVVYEDDGYGDNTVVHIASSEEKAKEWIRKCHSKYSFKSYIEEVEVDNETEICI